MERSRPLVVRPTRLVAHQSAAIVTVMRLHLERNRRGFPHHQMERNRQEFPRYLDRLDFLIDCPLVKGWSETWDQNELTEALSEIISVNTIRIICKKGNEPEYTESVLERCSELHRQVLHASNIGATASALQLCAHLRGTGTRIVLDPICVKLHLVLCSRLFYILNPDEVVIETTHYANPDRLGMLRLRGYLSNLPWYNQGIEQAMSRHGSPFRCNTKLLRVITATKHQLRQVTRDLEATFRDDGNICALAIEHRVARDDEREDELIDGYKWDVEVEFLHGFTGCLLLKGISLTAEGVRMCTGAMSRNLMALVLTNCNTTDNGVMDPAAFQGAVMEAFVNWRTGDEDTTSAPIWAACPIWAEMPGSTRCFWRGFGILDEKTNKVAQCGVLVDLIGVQAFVPVCRAVDCYSVERWRRLLLQINTESVSMNYDLAMKEVEALLATLIFLAIKWNPRSFLPQYF